LIRCTWETFFLQEFYDEFKITKLSDLSFRKVFISMGRHHQQKDIDRLRSPLSRKMSGFSRSEDKEPHSVFTTTNNDTQQERVDASEQRGLCCSYCCKWGAKATCSKCKFTTYCSTECQVADWKEGNHKHECKQSRHVASGNLEYMEQFREGLLCLPSQTKTM
jgi:hypothetical protein